MKVVVIGAGIGGLSIAALLCQKGVDVTLIEAHNKVGGCASNFQFRGHTFDVGATTLSGFKYCGPLNKFIQAIQLKHEIHYCANGVDIHYRNKIISLGQNTKDWALQFKQIDPNFQYELFFRAIINDAKNLWTLLSEYDQSPLPLKRSSLNKLKLSHLPLLFKQFVSMELHCSGISEASIRLLNELLLITTQSTIANSYYLPSILGLSYPQDVHYPLGGIGAFSQSIADNFCSRGGQLITSEKVENINPLTKGFLVQTPHRELKADIVICNILPQTVKHLLKINVPSSGLSQHTFLNPMSAFTVYLGVKFKTPVPHLYHQIHFKRNHPLIHSQSMFVSFSPAFDTARVPRPGYQTVTISVHTLSKYFSTKNNAYIKRKNDVTQFLKEHFVDTFNNYILEDLISGPSGSSHTFEHFTHRTWGSVGGIPHNRFMAPVDLGFGLTKVHNLYLVGDNNFPGQGIPGILLANMWLANSITK